MRNSQREGMRVNVLLTDEQMGQESYHSMEY